MRKLLCCRSQPFRDHLTIGKVFDAIELADKALREMGTPRPRIAVCGLNPHAGEGGILGEDENRVITPAIDLAPFRVTRF